MELRAEINFLREEVKILSDKTNEGWDKKYRNPIKWGCYIKDINAGYVLARGATKVEARGEVLEKCTAKNGVCFESRVKCSIE